MTMIDPIRKLDEPVKEKTYILLYYLTVDDGEEVKTFETITGRSKLYNFIKSIVENIDIHRSKVLVDEAMLNLEGVPSVYQLMLHFQDIFNDTSFDIEDYNYGDVD